jgi:glc operon protein GlcG
VIFVYENRLFKNLSGINYVNRSNFGIICCHQKLLNYHIMYPFFKVGFKEAVRLIEVAVEEAEKINKQVAVAVCGPEGELISFLRMDEASGAASVIAQNKAYTASRDRKTTREMGEFMLGHNRPPAFWGDKGITGFGGGVPIRYQSKVIGGIGVSGLSEEEDERIAGLAIKIVFG